MLLMLVCPNPIPGISIRAILIVGTGLNKAVCHFEWWKTNVSGRRSYQLLQVCINSISAYGMD